MNAKRWISGFALGALLIGQALPAHAGRMLCGMKERPRVEACTRCDGDQPAPSAPSLRAGTCCRIGPAEAPESTPAVLARAGRVEAPESHAADFVLPAAAGTDAALGISRAMVLRSPVSPPLLESPTRTTVLRN